MTDEDLVQYFIRRTDLSLQRLEKKVDELSAFRWRTVGASAAISIVVSLGIGLATIYFRV